MIGVWEFRASVAVMRIGKGQLEVTNVHWAPRKAGAGNKRVVSGLSLKATWVGYRQQKCALHSHTALPDDAALAG